MSKFFFGFLVLLNAFFACLNAINGVWWAAAFSASVTALLVVVQRRWLTCFIGGHRWRITRMEPTRCVGAVVQMHAGQLTRPEPVYVESANPTHRVCKRCGERQFIAVQMARFADRFKAVWRKETL